MSAFTLFALILLVGVTVFALYNPEPVVLRFLVWRAQTTVALAVVGGAVVGGVLVFISSLLGQQHLRARVRDLQARVRELEAARPSAERQDRP
ncbi:MAG: lipopolysaccharide assembly protein LapA domain-containing protein [Armatimonadota bacterium]|nr:lipopolysaccharide assembly protein LapA domain-containing protein [Armatimonadota bacterium]MDR7532384.1 lipopolysaccharide assembly protein LapA domain-containing protein [Armatimonadota bacterium]MDR7535311.1 lipopolysaccharide assembly protein LapA domain-containing protein [Armatimonadota bacterium]